LTKIHNGLKIENSLSSPTFIWNIFNVHMAMRFPELLYCAT